VSIRDNKARADRLVEEVLAERRARRAHSAQAKEIFLRRLGSPGGLAACFGAGAVAGFRFGEAGTTEEVDRRGGDRRDDGSQAGFLERFAEGPIGNIAVRLAAATVVRYMLMPHGGDGGGAAGEPAADVAAPGEY
jgi:hypothetical protein